MSIGTFLKDQKNFFFGWLLFIFLTVFVLWLTPGMVMDWSVIFYLVLIQGLVLLAFIVKDYFGRRQWWRRIDQQRLSLQNFVEGAHSEEEKLNQEAMNYLIRQHQQMMQQAIEAQQDQKDYIDSWAHEIKVPLAASSLLLAAIEDDIDYKKYQLLENELQQIDEYVEQVLYYARLDSFSRDYLIQEYSLKGIIQPVIRSQANYFIQKGIHFSQPEQDFTVLTDSKWVAFIFRQLVSNAIKYTPENGTITVSLSRDVNGTLLQLEDSGIGIPGEDLRRIFDKGFTGSNGRLSEQHSTGLGLYLAKSLSEKLGIQLTAESAVGQGTTISMRFPVLSYYNERR